MFIDIFLPSISSYLDKVKSYLAVFPVSGWNWKVSIEEGKKTLRDFLFTLRKGKATSNALPFLLRKQTNNI